MASRMSTPSAAPGPDRDVSTPTFTGSAAPTDADAISIARPQINVVMLLIVPREECKGTYFSVALSASVAVPPWERVPPRYVRMHMPHLCKGASDALPSRYLVRGRVAKRNQAGRDPVADDRRPRLGARPLRARERQPARPDVRVIHPPLGPRQPGRHRESHRSHHRRALGDGAALDDQPRAGALLEAQSVPQARP